MKKNSVGTRAYAGKLPDSDAHCTLSLEPTKWLEREEQGEEEEKEERKEKEQGEGVREEGSSFAATGHRHRQVRQFQKPVLAGGPVREP